MKTIFYLIAAYIIGAIPSGFLIAQLRNIQDIRRHGSGNIGATNVARVLGIRYFFIVFSIDALKAMLCLWLLQKTDTSYTVTILSAIALLLGNSYSIFLSGSGGKGIATSIGILAALHSGLLAFFLTVWSLAFLCTRIAGAAALASLVTLPIVGMLYINNEYLVMLCIFIAALCTWRHRVNLKQLVG
jgi:glycerol-3-phosphate acyltransferase PlsY